MGQKHSTKKHNKLKSRPECTEIIDLEFSVNDDDNIRTVDDEKVVKKSPICLNNLLLIQQDLNNIENDIKNMSNSEIHLYFPTFKDNLLNSWSKVFNMPLDDDDDANNDDVKRKKIELIERIKLLLSDLNKRYLNRST